jgi:transposase InsO family protein
MTAELHREGLVVNHKRVLRIMREDNLLCLRKRRFIKTTDSEHGLPIYPNLAKDLQVTGMDQLWVSDITYIRLQREFVYLAVVLDAFTRKVIGWDLSRRIDTELTLAALQMALDNRTVKPGLVHHSDRGVQYAATEYTNLLKEKGIAISMSRKGNPYDNAQAESFMKTLKYEEVYLSDYENLEQARESIAHFLNQVYNRERLHSRLGYVPPEEFEAKLNGQYQ